MPANLYPNVPNVPGVPQLLRQASMSLPAPVLAAADMLGLNQLLGGQQWGIFTSAASQSTGFLSEITDLTMGNIGSPVLPVDSIISVQMAKDFDIPDFPVEGGGFASYNKVQRPYEGKISMAIATSAAMRQDCLATLDQVVADLNLYSIVTPERVYENANIVHYDYERTSQQGVTLLILNISVKEVRSVAVATYASTRSPNGATLRPQGVVQGQQPTGFLSRFEDNLSINTGSLGSLF